VKAWLRERGEWIGMVIQTLTVCYMLALVADPWYYGAMAGLLIGMHRTMDMATHYRDMAQAWDAIKALHAGHMLILGHLNRCLRCGGPTYARAGEIECVECGHVMSPESE
jgi:membrane protease subunit (stomatin/prohibitin family)